VPVPGVVDEVAQFVRRLTAPNSSLLTGPGTNTYLVGEEILAVVDPGPDDETHLGRIEAAGGGRIRYVLVTHTHPDHAPGATPLAASSRAELCGYDSRDGFDPDVQLRNGDALDLGPVLLKAVHTPGHASNHLCYLVERAETKAAGTPGGRDYPSLLLSGDHIMSGSTVVILPPDGDMSQYMTSLERLLGFDPPIDAIGPGHGPVIEDPRGEIEALLAHRRAREQAVLAALLERGRSKVDDLVPIVYVDVERSRHPIARESLWAHLRKLALEGKAFSEDPDDIEAVWKPRAS